MSSEVTPNTRMSRQRREVLDNLASDKAFRSAQEIHSSLEQEGSSVGLATVYRNLQLLERLGDVDATRSEAGEMLYRICEAEQHHHHLICKSCGRTEEVELDGLEAAMRQLAADRGYTLTSHTVELSGLCPDCADKEGGNR